MGQKSPRTGQTLFLEHTHPSASTTRWRCFNADFRQNLQGHFFTTRQRCLHPLGGRRTKPRKASSWRFQVTHVWSTVYMKELNCTASSSLPRFQAGPHRILTFLAPAKSFPSLTAKATCGAEELECPRAGCLSATWNVIYPQIYTDISNWMRKKKWIPMRKNPKFT